MEMEPGANMLRSFSMMLMRMAFGSQANILVTGIMMGSGI